MRLIALTAVALVPSAAFAQTTFQARLTAPVVYASSASPAAPTTSATTSAVSVPVRYQDVVKTSMVSAALDESFAQAGTLSYTLYNGSDGKPEFTAPQLVHVVGRTLPVEQLANSNADVTIAMTVDPHGVPRDVKVVRSAGEAIDKGTLDAVRQYRFEPATYNNGPVAAHVKIQISIQK